MTVPYYDPSLNISSSSADWLIDGHPTFLWTTPGGATLNHFIVWRNTVDEWLTATNISGSLSAASTSYTDTTAVYGVGYYYWIIAYNAAGTYAGNNAGVSATQVQYVNRSLTWVALSGVGFNDTFPLPINIDGKFRSYGAYSFTSSNGNPSYGPPAVDYIVMQFGCAPPGPGTPAHIAAWTFTNSATYSTINWVAAGGTGAGGSLVTVPNNVSFTDPVTCTQNIAAPVLEVSTPLDPSDAPPSYFAWGVLNGNVVTAKVSYCGFASNGGGEGSPSVGAGQVYIRYGQPGALPSTPTSPGVPDMSNLPVGAASWAGASVPVTGTSGSATLLAAARLGPPGTGRVSITISNKTTTAVSLTSSVGGAEIVQLPGIVGASLTLNVTAAVYGFVASGSAIVDVVETF